MLEVSVVGKDVVNSLWQAHWEIDIEDPTIPEWGCAICSREIASEMLLDPGKDFYELCSVGRPKWFWVLHDQVA